MNTNNEILIPKRIERKITNRNGDEWFEYDGEQLFDDETIERLHDRFNQMESHDWEKLFTVKGPSGPRTKIRTKDVAAFKEAVRRAEQQLITDYGEHLTSFGNRMYGEPVGEMGVIEIAEEHARKTVVSANYQTGHIAFLGGDDGKRQNILLPVRSFEQWLYNTEVVEPLFDEYHEKYPY